MGLFRKSKESPEQTQPEPTAEKQPPVEEGKVESPQPAKPELSESEKEQINQRTAEIEQRIEEIKAIRTNEDTWNKLDDDKAKEIFAEYQKIKAEKEKLERKLEGKPDLDDEVWDKEAGIIKNVRFKKVTDKKPPLRPAPGHKFRHGFPSGETVSYISRHAGRPLVVLADFASRRELDMDKAYNVKVVDERPNKITVVIIE